MIKVNYTKNTAGEIASLTRTPFDESKPYLEMTEEQYTKLVTQITLKQLKRGRDLLPSLASYYDPRIAALEKRLQELEYVCL
jgi:hypothetical protein